MRLPSTSPISDRYRRRDRLYFVKIIYKLYLNKFYFMETATILGVLIAAALVGISGYRWEHLTFAISRNA